MKDNLRQGKDMAKEAITTKTETFSLENGQTAYVMELVGLNFEKKEKSMKELGKKVSSMAVESLHLLMGMYTTACGNLT